MRDSQVLLAPSSGRADERRSWSLRIARGCRTIAEDISGERSRSNRRRRPESYLAAVNRARKSFARCTSHIRLKFLPSMQIPEFHAQPKQLRHDPEWKKCCSLTSGPTRPARSESQSGRRFEWSCADNRQLERQLAASTFQTPREAPSNRASPSRRSQFLFGQTRLVRDQRPYDPRQVSW